MMKNKVIFKSLAINSDSEYLKYLNKEDFEKKNIHKVSFDMDRFNESLKLLQ